MQWAASWAGIGGDWPFAAVPQTGAIARDGMVAIMTNAAATSTAVFLAFIEQVLIPALRSRPEALVAMDNLVPRRAAAVRAALRRAGLAHRYHRDALPDALNAIVADDARASFRRCGYRPS